MKMMTMSWQNGEEAWRNFSQFNCMPQWHIQFLRETCWKIFSPPVPSSYTVCPFFSPPINFITRVNFIKAIAKWRYEQEFLSLIIICKSLMILTCRNALSRRRQSSFRFNAKLKLCHCKLYSVRKIFGRRESELNELEKLSIQCLSRNFNLNFN